jgi:hypothetical protein
MKNYWLRNNEKKMYKEKLYKRFAEISDLSYKIPKEPRGRSNKTTSCRRVPWKTQKEQELAAGE